MFGPHHHTPYDEDIEREEHALAPGGLSVAGAGPPGLDPDLRAAAIAARGFMPTDEGDALFVAGAGGRAGVPGRAVPRDRQLLRQVVGLARRGRPRARARCCSRSTTTVARRRTRRGGSGTSPTWSTPRWVGWTRCRGSGARSTTPASRGRSSRWSASRPSVAEHWQHPAGSAVHRRRPRHASRPTATTSAGRRTSPPAAGCASTTCSRTRPTGVARRTRSTSGRSRAAASRTCRRPVRSGCLRRI